MRFLLLSLTNELSSLQKRRLLIILVHLTKLRKIRSKLRITHLIEIVVALLMMWRFWIKRLLLWSFCMTRFWKIRSSKIWRFRSQWICRLSNISWIWMILLLRLLILILQWTHIRKIRWYNISKIRKHWKRILIRFTFTNFLRFLFSITTLLLTSKFIQSIHQSYNLLSYSLDENCNYYRFVISHCVTTHLTEIVAILILLTFASLRLLFVFLFRLSLVLFRMSFLFRLSLLLNALLSCISNFVRESNCSAFLLNFLSRRSLNALLNRIRTFMKKNNLFASSMLFVLLLLL